jgi:CBS domain-containing protein
MNVEMILSSKGREVITTQSHKTLSETAEVLSSRKIGAVIVADSLNQILGIISERDIVRAIAHKGAPALNDAVSIHMTTKVVTTTEYESLHTTVEKMTAGRFRHLPVLDGTRLVGIVSIGDVVKYRLAEVEHEHSAMRDYIATA